MTYGEVDDAASRLAAWLVSQGIKPGDVVTLQFPNWAEFTIAYVACFKAGAVIQCGSPATSTGPTSPTP